MDLLVPSWAMGPGVRGSLLFGLSLVGEVQLDIKICEVLFTALMNSKVTCDGICWCKGRIAVRCMVIAYTFGSFHWRDLSFM